MTGPLCLLGSSGQGVNPGLLSFFLSPPRYASSLWGQAALRAGRSGGKGRVGSWSLAYPLEQDAPFIVSPDPHTD